MSHQVDHPCGRKTRPFHRNCLCTPSACTPRLQALAPHTQRGERRGTASGVSALYGTRATPPDKSTSRRPEVPKTRYVRARWPWRQPTRMGRSTRNSSHTGPWASPDTIHAERLPKRPIGLAMGAVLGANPCSEQNAEQTKYAALCAAGAPPPSALHATNMHEGGNFANDTQ